MGMIIIIIFFYGLLLVITETIIPEYVCEGVVDKWHI